MRFGFASVLASLLFILAENGNPACAMEVEPFEGRPLYVVVPPSLPASGSRALVVVLHGGLGNPERIASRRSESALNMDSVAVRQGFIVAYPSGTPVTRLLGADKLGWNAGLCCGLPASDGIDDVGYLTRLVASLVARYGINPGKVYGVGHSNGALMTQRMICETTVYAAAVAVSGPLDTAAGPCPGAAGRRVLAIHGADDENVPIGGGRGTKGLSRADFASEAEAERRLTAAGATYTLEIVAGADHAIDHIDTLIRAREGQSIAEKSARFFGLLDPKR